MAPYLICFLFPAGICLFSHNKYSYDKKKIFIMLLPLALVIAFRGPSVGADTLVYNRMYDSMYNGTFEFQSSYERLEIGYKIFLWCLTRISSNSQLQFIVLAIFFIIVFTYFLYQNAYDPARFIILFLGLNVYSFYLTGIRQSIAMTICLLAYEKIKKRKVIPFILMVILASSFHKSALFFLPAYLIANTKFKKYHVIYYTLGFVLVAIFNRQIFSYGSSVFDTNYGIESTGNGYFMFGIVAITTLFSFIYMRRIIEYDNRCVLLIQLNIVSMALWILRLFSRTAERVALFYMPFTILLIIELILTIKDDRYAKLINLFATLFLGAYFIYRLNGTGLLPYVPFWR